MKKWAPKPSAAKADLYVKADGVTSENNHCDYMLCSGCSLTYHTEMAVVTMDIPG